MTVQLNILTNILLLFVISTGIIAEIQFKNDKDINWALDRIDQVKLPLDNQYHAKATGQGISIFLITNVL